MECIHKSFVYRLVDVPPFSGIQPQGVYQPCVANELWSLQGRHLVTNGEPRVPEWTRCLDIVAGLARSFSIMRPYTEEEVIAAKAAPSNRRRYTKAFRTLRCYGDPSNKTRVSAFIKVEKWESGVMLAKVPRLIQYRSFEYCAQLSRFLMPVERLLKQYKEPNGLKPFAKGMNSFQMAEEIVKMSSLWDDTVYVLADHSKFDSCIMGKWIMLEHKLYSELNPEDELDELMKMQYNNVGLTKGHIRYQCMSRKMSGEYNTSLGDTVINYCILRDVFRDVPHHVFVNGDDSVIAVPRSRLNEVDLGPDTWIAYGMNTKVEVVSSLEEVDFCQASPIQIRPGVWRMARKPLRAISRACVSVKRYQGIGWRRLVKSMAMSEMACSDGVPVLQGFAEYLLRTAGDVRHFDTEITYRAKLEPRLDVQPKPVTDVARESFEKSFGIDPTTQVAMECWFANHVSDVPLARVAPRALPRGGPGIAGEVGLPLQSLIANKEGPIIS